jgi:hypothetical protein
MYYVRKHAFLRLGQIRYAKRNPSRNGNARSDRVGKKKQKKLAYPYPCVTHRVELARFRSLRKDTLSFIESLLCV